MKHTTIAVLVLLVTALSLPGSAKMRGPSTAEERARALDYIQSLEENPIGTDTLEKRTWLTEWIVDVPDITVHVDYKELDSLDEVNNTYSNQLRMQAVYSEAAYILRHPNEKNVATLKAAGLSGTLRAYRAIQKFDPSTKYPVLDELMTLENQGKLVCYVQKHLETRMN